MTAEEAICPECGEQAVLPQCLEEGRVHALKCYECGWRSWP